MIKSNMKIATTEVGIIFGSINYENIAGIEQDYIVTREIPIDIIDFVYPSDISDKMFRVLWQKYEWENRVNINTQIETPRQYVDHMAKHLHMKVLNSLDPFSDTNFVSANLYAKSKLDDDFLINISVESKEGRLIGYTRLRSQTKGIVMNLGERIKIIQSKKL